MERKTQSFPFADPWGGYCIEYGLSPFLALAEADNGCSGFGRSGSGRFDLKRFGFIFVTSGASRRTRQANAWAHIVAISKTRIGHNFAIGTVCCLLVVAVGTFWQALNLLEAVSVCHCHFNVDTSEMRVCSLVLGGSHTLGVAQARAAQIALGMAGNANFHCTIRFCKFSQRGFNQL